jgi:hypothetical protein
MERGEELEPEVSCPRETVGLRAEARFRTEEELEPWLPLLPRIEFLEMASVPHMSLSCRF